MPIIFILALLLGGGVSYAAENAIPGDTLYPVKISMTEEVRGWFAFTDESNAEWEIERAERRVKEVAELAERGELNHDALIQIEENFEKHAQRVEEHIAKLEEKDEASTALSITSEFEASLKAHEEILNKILGDVDALGEELSRELEELEENIRERGEAAKKSHEQAMERLSELDGLGEELGDLGDELDNLMKDDDLYDNREDSAGDNHNGVTNYNSDDETGESDDLYDDDHGVVDGHIKDNDHDRAGDDGTVIGCTADAKICDDGSAVGRTGPNCEFAKCPETDDGDDWGTVEIQGEFENKVVYTINAGADRGALELDCKIRGGTFNNCGSVCGPDAESCIAVCAYTCENIGGSGDSNIDDDR